MKKMGTNASDANQQFCYLKDNSPIEDHSFTSTDLCKSLRNQTVETLLDEEGIIYVGRDDDGDVDVSLNQRVISTYRGKIRTQNLIGVLGDSHNVVSIATRFFKQNEKPVHVEDDYFFAYLLEKVLHVDVAKGFNFPALKNNRWKKLLVLLFPYFLSKALQVGAYRMYVRRQYNDSRLKGTVDVARYLNIDVPFIGRVAYTTRDLDLDNPVSELIRHTIEYIVSGFKIGQQLLNGNKNVRDNVRTIRLWTPRYRKAERSKIIDWNIQHPVFNEYFRSYRLLQKICVAILCHDSISASALGNSRISGILFDCSWLWEEYLNVLLHDKCNILPILHPRNKSKTGKQYLFGKPEKYGRNSEVKGVTGLIYPDFLISCASTVVADAKYKPINNIAGADYLQLLAYMYRFDSRYGQYWYPKSQENDESDSNTTRFELLTGIDDGEQTKQYRQEEQKVVLDKVGLLIPSGASTYEEYSLSMQKSEDQFVQSILALQNRDITI